MSKNKSLHQLIHSLSTNEKRFFKMYASRHAIGGENKYVKLFSLFEKVKTYDEQAIEAAVKKASFVKYFGAEKNYLYNLLLDCLDIYHRESSIDRQISKMINTGRVLMEKKLDAQSAVVLRKAKKLSQLHDRQENYGPINYLLKMTDFGHETVSRDSLHQYQQEEVNSLNQLAMKQRYSHAFERLLLHRRLHGITGNTLVVAYLVEDYPHLHEPLPQSFSSFGIQAYYLVSRLEYCRITRSSGEGARIANALIACMEQNRKQIAGEYIELYIYTLYIFIAGRLYKSETEAYRHLEKLRHLDRFVDARITKKEHASCFEYYFTSLTDLWLEQKEYTRIRDAMEDFERAFPVYQPYMTPTFVLAIHFNIACLYFGAGDYKEALTWTNKVRNTKSQFREDIFYDLRTLDLIIHFELGNYDILPSLFKSAAYHHKKVKHKVGLQKLLIRTFTQILQSNTKEQQQTLFKNLKVQLLQMKEDPQENRIFNDADLVAWVSKKCD